jgi:hypothetical protein
MLRKKTNPDAAGQGAIVDPDGESKPVRLAPWATDCPLGTCLIAEVTARVTGRVIYIIHAPVTSPFSKRE